jgi:hypothetical protein
LGGEVVVVATTDGGGVGLAPVDPSSSTDISE